MARIFCWYETADYLETEEDIHIKNEEAPAGPGLRAMLMSFNLR